ncbi:MAG: phosphoglycerate dehydrogenase [Gemmatimonadota bacterium]
MSQRFRVLVADAISSSGLAPLTDDERFDVVARTDLTPDELAVALAEADAVIVRSATRITREALASANGLRVIGRAGVGVDNIDVGAATERGIAVLNAPSGNTISAAELTLALLLSLVRRVPAADRSMRAGQWDRKSFQGNELYGKTLGLVGAGRIGGEVARRAQAFGMRVLAYDPFLSEERAASLKMELAELEVVLASADVVSVHVPLTDATSGLLDATRLAGMKRGAFLVNAARGGVVDEAALVEALKSGQLAGAALDVYAEEPLPADHPLRAVDNLVLTPHLGAATAEAQENVAVEIAEAVRAALLENDLARAINAPALGGEAMQRLATLLDLATRVGRLGAALVEGAVRRVEVRYAGGHDDALRPVLSSVLVGLLEKVVGRGGVNLVNAVHLAESRGITVARTGVGPRGDYADYVDLRATTAAGETRVTGALVAGLFPRIVRIREFHLNVRPHGSLVVLRNHDVPGVIGHVGTVLGEAGVNIAEYHQAREAAGGEAMAALNVDAPLPPSVVEALRGVPEVVDVRQVILD